MIELYEDCYADTSNNGLKVITEQREDRPLSLGLWVKAGSRDEPAPLCGVTHFVEHMIFKGTKNRTAFQIAEEIDALGGVINALTHKEYTLFFVDVLPQHLEPALDVLTDLIKNPLFKEEDIEKEKGVVLEEIRMIEDTPQEKVFDLFYENIWDAGHPLSWPISGREESIRSLNRESILSQFQFYHLGNMALIGVGDIEFNRLMELAQEKLQNKKAHTKRPSRFPPRSKGHFYIKDKDSQQAHLCLGTPGIKRDDGRRFALEILNTILGGGMSSRLFKRIREELGLAYAVFSSASYYLDSGLFLIYMGTEPAKARQAIPIVFEEIDRLKKEPVSSETLRLAKEKLKGNLLLGLESSHARMMRLGISEIYNLHMPIDDIIKKLEAVTSDEIQELAQEIFKNNLSLTAIGPEKGLTKLSKLFSHKST